MRRSDVERALPEVPEAFAASTVAREGRAGGGEEGSIGDPARCRWLVEALGGNAGFRGP